MANRRVDRTGRTEIRAVVPTELNEQHRLLHPGTNTSERVTRSMRCELASANPGLAEGAARDYTLVRVLLEAIYEHTGAVEKLRTPLAGRGVAMLMEQGKHADDAEMPAMLAAANYLNAAVRLPDALLGVATAVAKLMPLNEWRRTVGDVPPDEEPQTTAAA